MFEGVFQRQQGKCERNFSSSAENHFFTEIKRTHTSGDNGNLAAKKNLRRKCEMSMTYRIPCKLRIKLFYSSKYRLKNM